METAVKSLKKGKSAGVDNIPAELVQAGGEDVMTAVTTKRGTPFFVVHRYFGHRYFSQLHALHALVKI